MKLDMPDWKVLKTIVKISSFWLEIIAESIVDEKGDTIEYWRIEKDDSVIVIPFYRDAIILSKPFYRHGVKKTTYDFPGGRNKKNHDPAVGALTILQRELEIKEKDIISIKPLNKIPWHVNSSFSNQSLYGFIAEISSDVSFSRQQCIESFSIEDDMKMLLKKLTCLQCRCVLHELLYNNYFNQK
ncbi:MAG: hypothetical protein K9L30_13700 [Desulfobacterales bacterium]|nr:hypothetical protein [Desulfobacterales bacterium]